MANYILRRVGQSVLTIFSVMALTFLLFRGIAGDIAAAHVGRRATAQQRADWRHRHGYDLPLLVNIHGRLMLDDKTSGNRPLTAKDATGSNIVSSLAMILLGEPIEKDSGQAGGQTLVGRYVMMLSANTPLEKLTARAPPTEPLGRDLPAVSAAIDLGLSDGTSLSVDLAGVKACGELIERINGHPDNRGRLEARISPPSARSLFRSQFFHHLWNSLTFQSRSLKTNEKLTRIIVERAPKSLALTVPAMAIGWVAAMVISCFVAYYRNTWIDKVGVLISVLGMCIPFLAFMIFGQWLMFVIAPTYAYGLAHRANIFVPILIMVIAGLGGSVRFYRTVILDEVNRDYVRTARAKGVPLPAILFKHVLKNCMLPILTNIILAIPFLIMGSLLVESYFGIPGLGDLMLTSINGRDEPIMSGLVFGSSLIYTVGVLLTDISYAVFDPRIRLR